jgi:hypothetical protein
MQEMRAGPLVASQMQATATRAETMPLAVPPRLISAQRPTAPMPVVKPVPALEADRAAEVTCRRVNSGTVLRGPAVLDGVVAIVADSRQVAHLAGIKRSR